MPQFSTTRFGFPSALLLVAVISAACQQDIQRPDSGVGPSTDLSFLSSCAATDSAPGPGEGEIFGSYFENEARFCADPETDQVSLVPADPVPNFEATLAVNPAYPLMWEFWDTYSALDGPCSTSPRAQETSHAPPPGGTNREQHCVTRGTHQFTGRKGAHLGGGTRTFDVDYVGTVGSIKDSTSGSEVKSVVMAADSAQTPTTIAIDLPIHTDLGSTSYSDSVVLHLDASLNPDSATFRHSTNISVDSSYTLRASAYRTTVEWHGAERGRYLARIHYRVGAGSWVPLTNFFMPDSEVLFLRKFKLPAPTGCPASPITYTIGLEIMQPNQIPGVPSADDSAQRTVTITCPASAPSLIAPDSLGANSIGNTTATITWSNGSISSGVTTQLEIQDETAGWELVSNSIAAGVTNYNLSSLSAGTTYDVRVRHDSGGTSSSWHTTNNLFTTTVPAPSSIGNSDVTATSATVSWTNGLATSGTTTEVQYQPSGGSWIIGASGLAAGVTSTGLTGLTPSTSYSVQVRHNRSGISSNWTQVSALFTTSAAPSLTFSRATCDRYYSLSKWRIKHQLDWSGANGSWQVREAATNDTTAGSVIASGSSGSSMWTGEYLELSAPLYSYFWVKIGSLPWFPLAENAIETTACEA